MHKVRVARPVEARMASCDGGTAICRDGVVQQADCELGRIGARLAARGILGEGRIVARAATVEPMNLTHRCCRDRTVATVQARCLDDETSVGLSAEYVTGVSEEAGDEIRCEPD